MIAHYIGQWSQAQQKQLQLCEDIDALAGRLPLHDIGALDGLSERIIAVLAHVQRFEEEDLFPFLEAMSPQIRPLLVTFRSHHARDSMDAGAMTDMLAAADGMDDLRALKGQLAAFAESLRRHVQFEEAIAMALFASRRVDARRAMQ